MYSRFIRLKYLIAEAYNNHLAHFRVKKAPRFVTERRIGKGVLDVIVPRA